MINIRAKVFETNSSSTHSITMCTKETYDKWENGTLFFREYCHDEKQWYTFDEMIEHIRKEYGDEDADNITNLKGTNVDEFVEYIRDFDFFTFKSYEDYNYEYEQFEKQFTTPSGETVFAFGYYGSNY